MFKIIHGQNFIFKKHEGQQKSTATSNIIPRPSISMAKQQLQLKMNHQRLFFTHRLFVLVVFFASATTTTTHNRAAVVQAFQPTQLPCDAVMMMMMRDSRSSSSTTRALFYSSQNNDDDHDDERRRRGKPTSRRKSTTTSSSSSSTVFTNDQYIPPPIKVVPVPVRASPSPSQTCKKTGTEKWLPNDDGCRQYLVEIGENIRQAARQQDNHLIPATSKRLLQQAGETIADDMSVAWSNGDWEAFTYAALEASQTMKIEPLNRFHRRSQKTNNNRLFFQNNNNKLQQAYAGVAVELRVLSSIRYCCNNKDNDADDKQAQAASIFGRISRPVAATASSRKAFSSSSSRR